MLRYHFTVDIKSDDDHTTVKLCDQADLDPLKVVVPSKFLSPCIRVMGENYVRDLRADRDRGYRL
jgi:hypothetical protein